MAGQGAHKVQGVEALGQDLVQGEEGAAVIAGQEVFHHLETVFVVQDIEVSDDVLVFDIRSAESHRLVKDGEGVTHSAIGLGGYHVEGFVVYLYAFLLCNAAEVSHHIRDGDAVEVIRLAAAQDGGENLVLLRGGQNEDGVCRGLFQRFEESVESGLGEHVDLVYDVYTVLSNLRRHLHFLHQGLDVLYRVVGGGVQLVDAVASAFLETHAGLTLATGLHFRTRVGAVDHLGKDTCRGGLTHSAGAAEKIGVGQLPPPDGVGQRAGNVVLANQGFEGIRPILPGRYNVVTHTLPQL